METLQIIQPHDMAGVLRKLTERDIMLIAEDTITAVMIYQNFHSLANYDKTLTNSMFFDNGGCLIKFRSAPGVIHELRIRTFSVIGRRGLRGYGGDIVLHSCRPAERAVIERDYSPVWLHHYIKENGS